MAYVAVDKDGTETIFADKPSRVFDDVKNSFYWVASSGSFIPIPKGTIKKLIGKELTWEDEPVEFKEE